VTLEYVALTTTVPPATALTTPVGETVASAAFEVCQVARALTSFEVPSENVAIAVNCDVLPTAGGVPVTLMVETVAVGDVAVPLHATTDAASPIANTMEPIHRTMPSSLIAVSSRSPGTRHHAPDTRVHQNVVLTEVADPTRWSASAVPHAFAAGRIASTKRSHRAESDSTRSTFPGAHDEISRIALASRAERTVICGGRGRESLTRHRRR
jgi:hypothetical protein